MLDRGHVKVNNQGANYSYTKWVTAANFISYEVIEMSLCKLTSVEETFQKLEENI